MRHILLLSIISAMVLLAGCVRSLYPLFTEKESIYEPKLVGSWPQNSEEAWKFTRSGDNTYVVQIPQKVFNSALFSPGVPGDTGVFEGRLGRLGDDLFLDLFPTGGESSPGTQYRGVKNDFYNWHYVPTHSILRVRFDHDSLLLAILDNTWLKKMIENKSVAIPHERMDDQILLTASTEQLQELVKEYASNDEAFVPIERLGHMYH